MSDPLIAPDGHSYERRWIVRWLSKKHTSPVTGEAMPFPMLIPNHALRETIHELASHEDTCLVQTMKPDDATM